MISHQPTRSPAIVSFSVVTIESPKEVPQDKLRVVCGPLRPLCPRGAEGSAAKLTQPDFCLSLPPSN